MSRNASHRLLQRFERLPLGLLLFSRAVCFKAPYFGSISPRFLELRPGYARTAMKMRRRVTNHLGLVHAIAMANLCEFTAGTLMEISIRPEMRWIPRGMDITYLAKASTNLMAVCEVEDYDWSEKGDVDLSVGVWDAAEVEVARARIPMYLSRRRPAGD